MRACVARAGGGGVGGRAHHAPQHDAFAEEIGPGGRPPYRREFVGAVLCDQEHPTAQEGRGALISTPLWQTKAPFDELSEFHEICERFNCVFTIV